LEKFDPYPFVRSWLATGNRMSTSWVPGPAAAKTVNVHQELLQQIFMPDNKWHVWCGLL